MISCHHSTYFPPSFDFTLFDSQLYNSSNQARIMAKVSAKPEDWSLRDDYALVGDIVLPRLRLLGINEMQPNQESIHPPPPHHQNDRDIPDSFQRTREEEEQIQARPSNLTLTPIELMIPGLEVPAMDQVAQNQIAELSPRQLPKFHGPTLNSDVGDEVHSNHHTSSPPSQIHNTYARLPDNSLPDQLSASSHSAAQSSLSYLYSGLVVPEEPNFENLDWRRYDPPRELLDSQDSTSADIRNILESSAERIRVQHTEEEVRAAASRARRPLARARGVPTKPSLVSAPALGIFHSGH
jgi:hypothetical protein